MVFFGASVLIAATLAGHPAHERAARRHLRAQPGKDCFAAHPLAEADSVLTGIPRKPRILPAQAIGIISAWRLRLRAVDLPAEDLSGVLARQAESGTAGGRIFDALLAGCAPSGSAR